MATPTDGNRYDTMNPSAVPPPAPEGTSGQVWIWVAGQEPAACLIVDERVVGEPLDGAAPGAGIAEGVPRRQQVRMLLVELVFEPAEGSLALDGPCQPAPGLFIGNRLGEVRHVLVPDPGRQRVDADQVQVVEVDRRLTVDAGIGRPEHDLPGLR